MEINKRLCKCCGQLRQRIEDGKYPNGKNKKWRDEDGKLWSGSVCGQCNNGRAKEVMRKARHDKVNSGT
jgi:hypothetical protein